jgi:hypothetical protein
MRDRTKRTVSKLAAVGGGAMVVAALPLYAVPVAAATAVVGGAAVAAGTGMEIERRYSRLMNSRRGVSITLVGPRYAGKTALKSALVGGKAVRGTTIAQKHGPESVRVLGAKKPLRIKSVVDTPGGAHAYGDWWHFSRQSDVMLYLFNISKLLDTDYHSRILVDAAQVGRILAADDGRTPRLQIVVLATHVDLDPRYSPEDPGRYWDNVMEDLNLIVDRFGGHTRIDSTFGVCDPRQRDEMRGTVRRIADLLRRDGRAA